MNEELTQKLERIKAACRRALELAAAATAGPWDDCSRNKYGETVRIFSKSHYIGSLGNSDDTPEQTASNAAAIAHARSFSPAAAQALLTAIEALELNAEAYALRSDGTGTTVKLLKLICDQWEASWN